jgi:hypothetical protein
MMIMGFVWSMYGIGYQGRTASWKVLEINYDNQPTADEDARTIPPRDDLPDPRELIEGNALLEEQFPDDPTARQPQLGDLLSADPNLADDEALAGISETDDGWELLASADPQTGEAVAAASAYLVEERQLFEASDDFVVLDSWSQGGKDDRDDDSLWGRAKFKAERIVTWPLGHPEHKVVVRAQQVVPREQVPGQPPPIPEADGEQPVVSVVMVRDLGSRRQPAIFLTIACAIAFGICCNVLHRRDKLVAEARAAAGS